MYINFVCFVLTNSLVSSILLSIKSKLSDTLEFKELLKSQEFVSNKFEEFSAKLISIEKLGLVDDYFKEQDENEKEV